MVALGFLATVGAGTLLLRLPIAATGRSATFVEALFTATSATCVTGLIVVDTETFWTPFGQAVILALIQLGGFGVMTVATLLGLLVSRRLGLSTRMIAAASTRTLGLGEVRSVLFGAMRFTVIIEVVIGLWLALRFATAHGASPGQALWSGMFHAISAFNNAGFSLNADSLMPFSGDALVLLPISAAVIIGGLGFPVLLELWRAYRTPHERVRRWRRWSVHTRLTLLTTAALLVLGTVVLIATEWGNPATFGAMDPGEKVLNAFTASVMPRTAGFNAIDVSQMNNGSWLFTVLLMFVGAGSGGTGGGIKVGTFAVLAFVIWSELRGHQDVTVWDRRLSPATVRQATTVALLGVAAVVVPTVVMTATTHTFSLDQMLFEVTSAFTTTGLSTGITAALPGWQQLVLAGLMFIGRLGPITLGTSLALRERERLFRRPETQLIIG